MVFVTGGTGLIGSFLLQALRARGLAVRALHRGPVPAPAVPGVEWVAGDLLDTEQLRAALTAEVTHVFHCAGLVSYAPQDEDQLLAVNVQGTAAVVDACLERPGIRLVHVSSVAALGG
ncbi:NAD-dependent epimerase/dehydratase family protein, partial [Hymenobacter agri]